MTQLIPVILCGGSGSRLWPVSREQYPKPFIRLADGQSFLQKTFLRGIQLPHVNDVIMVTNRDFFFKTEDEIAEVSNANIKTSYIIEPFARNTAAAIAAAALRVSAMHDENALLMILAADHLIPSQDAFQHTVSEAIPLAIGNTLVTFGITPHAPHTGYGYIEAEDTKALCFVEKPTLEKAKEYVASGRFLWNSGMFFFRAGAILHAMKTHCPDILSSVETCITHSDCYTKEDGSSRLELNPKYFEAIPENSIDYAVMEKSDSVAVVKSDMDWTDVGSWSALEQFIEPNQEGNRIEGEVCLHQVENCTIKANERLVGAVGVRDLFIIDTPDALLVADKTCAQEVKQIYTQLKSSGHITHKFHTTVHRPWGTFTILGEGKQFKIKRIEVKPGASLSLQMHYHRSEHWIVVNGMAKVTNGEKEFFVRKNESTYIPAGCQHRLENPGILNLVMIEVQSGDYLGEDDIVRFEDVYGRI